MRRASIVQLFFLTQLVLLLCSRALDAKALSIIDWGDLEAGLSATLASGQNEPDIIQLIKASAAFQRLESTETMSILLEAADRYKYGDSATVIAAIIAMQRVDPIAAMRCAISFLLSAPFVIPDRHLLVTLYVIRDHVGDGAAAHAVLATLPTVLLSKSPNALVSLELLQLDAHFETILCENTKLYLPSSDEALIVDRIVNHDVAMRRDVPAPIRNKLDTYPSVPGWPRYVWAMHASDDDARIVEVLGSMLEGEMVNYAPVEIRTSLILALVLKHRDVVQHRMNMSKLHIDPDITKAIDLLLSDKSKRGPEVR